MGNYGISYILHYCTMVDIPVENLNFIIKTSQQINVL